MDRLYEWFLDALPIIAVGIFLGRWTMRRKLNDLAHEKRITEMAAREIIAAQKGHLRVDSRSDADLIRSVADTGSIDAQPKPGSTEKPR